MFKKNANGKGKFGMMLYVLSIALVGYGTYQLHVYGQQAIPEGLFPYQAIALFVVALMMTVIASTLVLLGKGDQIMDKMPVDEPEEERYPTGKEKEHEAVEKVQQENKSGFIDRIKQVPIWIMVVLSIILAISLTSLAMLAVFGF